MPFDMAQLAFMNLHLENPRYLLEKSQHITQT